MWSSLLLSAYVMMKGTGNMSDLVFLLLVLDIVLDASKGVKESLFQILKVKPSYENIQDILASEKIDGSQSLNTVDEIVFENVSFAYGSNTVLSNFNERLVKGDIVHIVGKNGAGKSTIVRLLNRLLTANQGEIRINGKNINDYKFEELIKNIVTISQNEKVINDSVETYTDLVNRSKQTEKEKDALYTNLGIVRDRAIEDLGASISGGQKKKMLLAKLCLNMKSSSIIILDEIENEMDKYTREKLIECMDSLYQDREKHIILIISHTDTFDDYYTKNIYI